MKSINIICFLISFLFFSCNILNTQDNSDIEKLLKNNALKVTISTGLSGTLLMKEGDCMPTIPVGRNSSCKEHPISRTINIYEYTGQHNIAGYGPLFDSVNSLLINQCTADQDGFFQVTLDPGKYSVFIMENDKFYANSFDGLGGIYPIDINADSVGIIELIIDYASYK